MIGWKMPRGEINGIKFKISQPYPYWLSIEDNGKTMVLAHSEWIPLLKVLGPAAAAIEAEENRK